MKKQALHSRKRDNAPADATKSLENNDALTRQIVDALPCGIVIVAAGGAILQANDEAMRLLGLTRVNELFVHDFKNKTIYEDGRECPVEDYPVSKCLRTGKPQPRVVIGVRKPDGATSWCVFNATPLRDAAGAQAGAIVTFTDITAQKVSEQALRESESRWRAVVMNAPDVIIIVGLDLKIQSINHTAPGMRPEDVVGRTVFDFVPPESHDRLRAIYDNVRATGKPGVFNYEYVGPGGRKYSYNSYIAAIQNEGCLSAFMVIADEITGQLEAEAGLRQKSSLLELLQRIAVASNEASSLDSALKTALEQVCRYASWPVGHALVLAEAGDVLVSTGFWHTNERYQKFKAATESRSFARQIGLPGRVLASGKPACIVDLASDPNFPRAQVASEAGLRSAFAFPVMVASEVVAVLEFFSPKIERPDESILEAMGHIGTQLGRVVERQRAEAALRRSEIRYRAFIEQSTEGIWRYELREPLDIALSEDEQIEHIYKHAYLAECNDSLARMYRYKSAEEMKGFEFGKFLVRDAPQNIESLRLFIRSNYRLLEVESHEIDRDGNKRYFVNNVIGVLEDGKLVRAWGAQRDITQHKLASETLRESELRFRTLIEANFDGIVVHDNGVILETNHGIVKVFGYTREEMIGTHVLDYLADDCKEMVMRNIRDAYELPFESRCRHKDGAIIDLEATGKLYNYKGRMVRVAALRDITERKRAENALRAERDFNNTLVQTSPTFFVAIGLDGRTLMMNNAMLQALGYSLDEVLGTDYISTFVPERDRALLQGVFQTLSLDALPTLNENRVLTKDGRELLVEWHGRPVQRPAPEKGYFFGVGIDITRRRQVEEALRESEERLRSIFNSADDIIFLIDREHRYLSINKHTRTYNVEPEEIVGRTIFDLQPPEIARKHAEYHNTVFETGAPLRVETSFEAKIGTRWHSLTLSPVCNADGRVVAITGISRDITDLKRAERERLVLERKMLETQKLESLGVLAGGIAHDFNNLLAAILGNVSLASMQAPLDSQLRPYLSSIETTTHRAAELCKQMLAYAGKGHFVVQHVDLNAVIEEMSGLLKISIGRTILLKFNLARDLPPVVADATQVRQVVMNLILNASEAIGENTGAISLTTGLAMVSAADVAATYFDSNIPAGRYALIEVSDTGCGMDAETRAKIFDPFFTTKFTGRGLGLAAVLGIVRGHKGAITVESVPGRGTSFKVLLPILPQS